MKSGLLWYDKSDAPLGKKIDTAMKRYKSKYGAHATVAYVNPSDWDRNPLETKVPIDVHTKTNIMPNHIWLGVKTQ